MPEPSFKVVELEASDTQDGAIADSHSAPVEPMLLALQTAVPTASVGDDQCSLQALLHELTEKL